MVGIVLVGHCNLAEELHTIVKMIVGDVPQLQSVSVAPNEPPDDTVKRIAAAIKKVDTGDGVLMLVDMFGGTPSNLSLTFLDESRVEVVTGVNVPMLVRIITLRESKKKNLAGLAKELKSYGRKNICIASEILNSKDVSNG